MPFNYVFRANVSRMAYSDDFLINELNLPVGNYDVLPNFLVFRGSKEPIARYGKQIRKFQIVKTKTGKKAIIDA